MYDLNDFQKDALKELGSLGSGKASAALSTLVDTEVRLDVPFVDLVPTKNVPNLVGGPRKLVIGTYSTVIGDVSGTIVVVFPIKSARLLVDILNKEPSGTCEVLKLKDRDNIRKIGEILSSAYLETLAEFLDIHATHEDPRIVSAFGESLPDFVLLNITGEYALLLKTVFKIPSTEELEGNFVLLLTAESIEKLLETIKSKLS
ncbi:MAG: chemotaxis protein CheC [Candidatus Altiarchaeota archaeon]|nr:chemotaxis protein CheC [Candidatus Altiarchaeota archaeon]